VIVCCESKQCGIVNTGRAFRAHDLTYSLDPELHLGLIQDAPKALFRSITDMQDEVLIYSNVPKLLKEISVIAQNEILG
jgi:hypothetical protein